MTGQERHFLLVPDGSAARRVRRALAGRGARAGVVVGTWPELLETARRAYLVAPPAAGADEVFARALAALDGAFWAESIAVAPRETQSAVAAALVEIAAAWAPLETPDFPRLHDLPARARRRIGDLLRLAARPGVPLPGDLELIREVIAAPAVVAIARIRVYRVIGIPALARWQAALIDKLDSDTGFAADPGLAAALEETLRAAPAGARPGALAHLQDGLFAAAGRKMAPAPAVQFVGVRDFLEEAEVAAGMVQQMLAADPALRSADVGLLLPESFPYAVALADAFTRAGIALSGNPVEHWRRDLGREAVYHFLHCRQKPAPAMAIAVCLTSPLMPWSREEGARLAQAVMDGDYALEPPRAAPSPARAMLDLVRGGDTEPAALAAALRAFVGLLDGGEDLGDHVHAARAAAERLGAGLEAATGVDWQALRRAVIPETIVSGETPEYSLEGATVWREGREPWRAVRRLIVLGFAEGAYPALCPASPVFTADELDRIQDVLAWPIDTPRTVLLRRRALFKRQLGAVAEAVTFLIPRRDPAGMVQAPSATLVFMEQLFDGTAGLVLDLDATTDRAAIGHLAVIEPAPPVPPRILVAEDLVFDRDLVALRVGRRGTTLPESPSTLATLMVSPLAWLLALLGIEARTWAPEDLDPARLGTLAHEVFEGLFRPGRSLAPDAIADTAQALLDAATGRHAPFLRAAQWQVERRHFTTGLVAAARAWQATLAALDAEVLASEVWLGGDLDGMSIHGKADALLGLPGDRLLVVDYKRSSARRRRPGMQSGYDSQAHLYRRMLETGGIEGGGDEALAGRIRRARQIGVAYFMQNDRTILADTLLPECARIPGWDALDNDVAALAMQRITRRLGEVRAGRVRLNRTGDAAFFEKQAKITPHALDASPLIAIFTRPGDAEDLP